LLSISGLNNEGDTIAEAIFQGKEAIDKARLKGWLEESIRVQWNYKDIVKNKGRLEPL